MDGRRRMDISATQVTASVLAAVTGAVAASFLGVAGTVIGAAVMSVASTAVAGIYKHGIARSKERLQAAGGVARITPLVGGGAMAAYRSRQRATGQPKARDDQTRDDQRTVTRPHVPGERRVTGPDAEPTEVFPVVGAPPPAEFHTRPWHEADQFATQPRDPAPADGGPAGPADRVTATYEPAPADGPASSDGPASADGATRADRAASSGGGAHARRDPGSGRRPRVLVLAGLALGIFLLAMAGITVFEAVAGKPLDALVGGKSGSGTTIGSIVGRNPSHHTKPASPAVTPHSTPTPGASTGPSPTPSPSPSPSPSPAASPAAGGDSPDTMPSTPASSGAAPGGTSAPGRSP
jgi:hypothetical protein